MGLYPLRCRRQRLPGGADRYLSGAEEFYIIAPDTSAIAAEPSLELAQQWFPDVPVRGDLSGHRGFFDCSKAQRLLGWTHPTG